ncbi:unnamed protein product [Ilex paraguariensis]|uniref:MORF/ORRM1/DAG-like MORF domain-containing protein n=1 Tax=Ilex paraguariensis TaxID=185542 RepID=A0ABC8TFQ6_9AQUA
MALCSHRLRRALSLSSSLLNRHHHHHQPLSSIPTLSTPPSLYSTARNPCLNPTQLHHLNLPFQSRLFRSSTVSFRRYSDDIDADKIGPDTILFEGCDYNHWLITMDFPKDPKPSAEEMVETYVQTCAKVVGSVEEAKKRIYACSTTTYQGFQLECTEEMSEKFRGLPGVVFILPDSYIDPVNKEYGGDKYINGTIIPRPPPVQYGSQRGRYNDRNRDFNRQNRPRDFGPPQQNYGPPGAQQNIPPRPNYGPPGAQPNISPQQNYDPPRAQPNFPPQQNYGPPGAQQTFPPGAQQNFPLQQKYGPPGAQQNFPPQQNYGPPGAQQNYGPPGAQQNYGPPGAQQNYGPPGAQQNFPPQQNYGPPGAGERRDPVPSYEVNYNQGERGNSYPQGQRDPQQRDFRGDNRNYAPPQGRSYENGLGGTYEQGVGIQGQGMATGYGQGEDQRFSQVDQRNNTQGDQRHYATMGHTGPDQGRW